MTGCSGHIDSNTHTFGGEECAEGVCPLSRRFGTDERTPAAAKSRQNRSPLWCVITTSSSDPDVACSCRWCLLLACRYRAGSGCLCRCWRHRGDVSHQHPRPCFGSLRQIRSVWRSLPQHAVLKLIQTVVITKLDQCNSVLVGASAFFGESSVKSKLL